MVCRCRDDRLACLCCNTAQCRQRPILSHSLRNSKKKSATTFALNFIAIVIYRVSAIGIFGIESGSKARSCPDGSGFCKRHRRQPLRRDPPVSHLNSQPPNTLCRHRHMAHQLSLAPVKTRAESFLILQPSHKHPCHRKRRLPHRSADLLPTVISSVRSGKPPPAVGANATGVMS